MAKLAPSLHRLFNEIDARWPNRDRRTDGWYADPKKRKSKGHNPGARGYSHAIDVDDDGINEAWIIDHIYRGGNVLWYIIWNRKLYSRTYGWRPRPYSGPSPHTDHMHIEIYQTVAAESFSGGWGIAPADSGMGQRPPGGGNGESGMGSAPGYDPNFSSRDYRGYIDASATSLARDGYKILGGAGIISRLRK